MKQSDSKIEDRKTAAPLLSLTNTVRTEGWGWLLRRLRYRTPISASGSALHTKLRRCIGLWNALPRAIQRTLGKVKPVSEDALYAFYDLQVAPISYDVSWFAASADRTRRQMGLSQIYFVIVPGTKDGFREERAAYEAEVDTAARRWRLYNVVLPLLALVPASVGLMILPSRDAAKSLRATVRDRVYPAHYEPSLPVAHLPAELLTATNTELDEIGVLRSPVQGLRYIEHWMTTRLSGRKLITITLRDYTYMPARNSNLEAWSEFAKRLDPAEYFPVFVLDTERTLDCLPSAITGFEVFPEASWNVWLRMALYESSYLNLGVNNGPLFTCVHNARTRFLIFKIVTPSVAQTTEEFMVKLGFKVGGQVPFATPFQRLVWEDDTLEIIEREFYGLDAQIKAMKRSMSTLHD